MTPERIPSMLSKSRAKLTGQAKANNYDSIVRGRSFTPARSFHCRRDFLAMMMAYQLNDGNCSLPFGNRCVILF